MARGFFFLLLGAQLAGLLSGCVSEPARARAARIVKTVEKDPLLKPDRVIAEINGSKITQLDFYRRILGKYGTSILLDELIVQELFYQEAKKLGLEVRLEEVEKSLDDLIEQEALSVGGKKQLEERYRERGLTMDDVRRDYARTLESRILFSKVVRALRTIDEEDIKGYYNQVYSKKRYKVRHIAYKYPLGGLSETELIQRKIEAREKAESAARRIREGADFAEIARRESADATGARGGELGFISEDQVMGGAMKDVLSKLKLNEVSDPVENDHMGAYHIVQITEIAPPRKFDECKDLIRKELEESEPSPREIQEVLRDLRSRATVNVLGLDIHMPPEGAAPPAGAGNGEGKE